jgi:nucleoside-diphosphate kinase
MERTLVILKPDALHRGLAGRILARFEDKGLQLCGLKLMRISRDLAHEHYAVHREKPFFGELVDYVTGAPVLVAVLAGHNAITVVRKLLGATFGYDAEPGTVRGDYSSSRSYNLVHGSDSPEAASREIALFFREEEVLEWRPGYMGFAYRPAELDPGE